MAFEVRIRLRGTFRVSDAAEWLGTFHLNPASLEPAAFEEPVARAHREVREFLRPRSNLLGRREQRIIERIVGSDGLASKCAERLEEIVREQSRLHVRHPEEELA